MPPKRPIKLKPPVPSSSEDEDQGSESDQGSELKSESEELNSNNKTKNRPAPPSDDDDDDDEEDSGSGSGSEESESECRSHKPHPTVKPPMEDPAKSAVKKITRSKPVSALAGVKRPAENEPKLAKKKLVISEEEENGAKKDEDQKKPLFQRLWSEDDELVILKGIRDFVAKKGIDSFNNMNAFHDFVKGSLHVDASTSQLQDKVRRLKKKFLNNVSKEKDGKNRIFSKPHDQKSYDASKKIWASDGKLLGLDSSKVNKGSARKNSAQPNARLHVEQSGSTRYIQFGSSVGVGDTAVEYQILNDGLEYIERSKRVELEEKWKTLRVEEYQLYLKKVELMEEMTTLVLEAIKAGEEN